MPGALTHVVGVAIHCRKSAEFRTARCLSPSRQISYTGRRAAMLKSSSVLPVSWPQEGRLVVALGDKTISVAPRVSFLVLECTENQGKLSFIV